MKVLVVTPRYYPENFKINEICEELVKEGSSVTVLTGLPNYPEGIVPKEYRRGKNRLQTINGVEVVRANEIGRRHSPLFLMLNYASAAICTWFKVSKLGGDYDFIYVYGLSPVTAGLAAVRYKKKHKTRMVYYCLDLWPESVKAYGIYEKNLVFKIARVISKKIYEKADVIAVTSKPFLKYFTNEHGISKDKLIYLPQHAEAEWTIEEASKKYDGEMHFLFAGNIGKVQSIDNILKAISMIDVKEKFMVDIVGSGSNKEYCEKLANELQLNERVIFHGRVPGSEMIRFYKMADVCIVSLNGGSMIGQTLPAKMQGYMAVGKPILGFIDGAASEIIKESNCGISVKADDVKELAIKMKELVRNPQCLEEYGKNSFEYYEKHFTKKRYMDALTSILRGGSLDKI